jgi:hypothetical protein
MSNQPADLPGVSNPGSPAVAQPSPSKRQSFFQITPARKIGTIAGAIMIVLALIGVGLTTSRSEIALTYWIWLVPVYGLLCIATAGARQWHEKGLRQLQLVRQVAHWLGIGLALWIDFLIRRAGEETATAAALNAMMLLALGCYLAGVHLEWHFILVGAVLLLATITVAKANQYSWLIFVVGAFAVVAMLGWRWLITRWHTRKAAP